MFEEEFNRNIRAEGSKKVCISSSKFLSSRQDRTKLRLTSLFPISHLSETEAYPHLEKLHDYYVLVIIIFNSNWLFEKSNK